MLSLHHLHTYRIKHLNILYNFDFSLIQTYLGQLLLLAGLESLSYSRSPIHSFQNLKVTPRDLQSVSSPRAPFTRLKQHWLHMETHWWGKSSQREKTLTQITPMVKGREDSNYGYLSWHAWILPFGNVIPWHWYKGKVPSPHLMPITMVVVCMQNILQLTKGSYAPWSSVA